MASILQLSLIAFRGLAPAIPQVREYDQDEILIGRAPDNDFVVEDPERYCSRYHARCYRAENQFFVEDTSTPGTQVNAGQFLTRGNRHRLVTGDILHIGECQLQVEVVEPVSLAPSLPQHESFSIDDFFSEPASDSAPIAKRSSIPNIPFTSSADYYSAPIESAHPYIPPEPLQTHIETPPQTVGHEISAVEPASDGHIYQEYYVDVEAVAPEIHGSSSVEPVLTIVESNLEPAEPVQAVQPATDHESAEKCSADVANAIDSKAIKAFLQGLNVEPEQLVGRNKEEIMFSAGQMLRVLTQGTMEILQSRNEVKKEFGMDVTRIGAQMNNPLKFSQTADEAMLKLLTHAEGYMSAHDAVKEGVVDAKAHQVAVMSGMQAAIISMLERFKPETLEEQLTSRFVLSRKGKYWETYKDVYQQLVTEAEDDFHALFGDEFTHVYLQQVREIESSYSQE